MTFRQADNTEVQDSVRRQKFRISSPGYRQKFRTPAPQKFRIPAEVRNRMNMITGTMYLIMIL